jgi:hypothetical protein
MEQLYSLSPPLFVRIFFVAGEQWWSKRRASELLHSLRREDGGNKWKSSPLGGLPRSKPSKMHTKRRTFASLSCTIPQTYRFARSKKQTSSFCASRSTIFFPTVYSSQWQKLVASGKKFCVAEKPQFQEENEENLRENEHNQQNRKVDSKKRRKFLAGGCWFLT